MRSRAEYRRRFGYALAVSVAVHAIALLGGLPALRESLQEPAPPPPLVTRMVELPKQAEPAPLPFEKRKVAARRREIREPEPVKAVPEPLPTPAPAREAVAPPSQFQPSEAPQADNRAAEAITAAQYRMQVIAYAQRHKPSYPRLARESDWTGEVTLEITLRADGQAELGLRRGSGHEVLDKLALDTYQQALRVVPVPPALRGRQVRLEPLRVIYNLTE